ncbi:formin-like protein 2 [Tanacetum coccineum]|uniref:Formin-like protein 2 n=1 Tax=Tanacetum coccineum TaxID=301880 RepID=A0ABQ4WCV6_9ASTR
MINQLHNISSILESQTQNSPNAYSYALPSPPSPLIHPPTNALVEFHLSFCHCCSDPIYSSHLFPPIYQVQEKSIRIRQETNRCSLIFLATNSFSNKREQVKKFRKLRAQDSKLSSQDGVFVVERNRWDMRTCQWQSVEADIKRSRDMVADEYVSQAVIEHDDAIQHVEEISKKKYILKLNAHQNIAILLRPLNVTIEDVCDALLQGNSDTLGTELLASLLMMDPRTNTGTLSAGFFTLRWKLGSCPNWSVADMTLDKVVDYIKRETNQFFHCS